MDKDTGGPAFPEPGLMGDLRESLAGFQSETSIENKPADSLKGHVAVSGKVILTEEQAQQIEEALTGWTGSLDERAVSKIDIAISAIRAARAQEQAEQEPVAWVKFQNGEITHAELSDGSGADMDLSDWTPLYAAPVRTKDLTDEFLVGATEVE